MFKRLFFIFVIISVSNLLNSCQKPADEHYKKASEFAKADNYKSAIHELDKAIEINPAFARAYYDRGGYRTRIAAEKAYDNSNQGDISACESSINDFTKAMELDPALRKDALLGRAYLTMINLKDPGKAIADFEEVLKIDAANKQAASLAIFCKLDLKDTSGAKLMLDKMISRSPNDAENYLMRSQFRFLLKDSTGGCEDLKLAKKLYNPSAEYVDKYLKDNIERSVKKFCRN